MDLIEPLPLLEEPEDGEAEPGPPFMPVPDSELSTLTQSRQLRSIPHRDDSSKAVPSELGQRLALRVLRDALTLQLARRGFDGLRSSALNLLAEIAGDFIRALGAELQQLVPAEPATAAAVVPLVLRAQHVVNMRSLADWRHAQATFARQVGQRDPIPDSLCFPLTRPIFELQRWSLCMVHQLNSSFTSNNQL